VINLLWLLAAGCLAALVHIVSVLLLPALAEGDVYNRLRPMAPRNDLALLPQPQPMAAPLPFMDPAVATAVCHYDVNEHPLRLRIGVPDAPLSVSFLQEGGSVFYALTDRAAVRGVLDVLLLTSAQLAAVEAEDADDEAVQELRLVVPRQRGLAIIRSAAATPTLLARHQDLLEAVTCESEPVGK
jgi:uncharacterized membrane protein